MIYAVSIIVEHWFNISQFNPYMTDLKPVCNVLLDGVLITDFHKFMQAFTIILISQALLVKMQ
jgi:hypothetical protein